jgi:hypothetical protein
MMMKLKNNIDFLSSHGYKSSLNLFLKYISRQLALSESVTYFFLIQLNKNNISNFNSTFYKKLKFEVLKENNKLNEFRNKKLYTHLPTEKWFENGSICYLATQNNDIISYAWIHKKYYNLDKNLIFNLKENEAWLGPSFVNPKYRNLGINSSHLSKILFNLENEKINHVLTCINSKNYSAIRAFIKNNVQIIGVSHIRKLFNLEIKSIILNLNNEFLLSERLR